MKRILIASACLSSERSYDVAVWKKKQNIFSVNAPMTEHFGLRFLKANHPEITILEYPTREQFATTLEKGWDVVGISFYINESNEALWMAETARKLGTPEVWAGNYGAMTPTVASSFDRSFLGWGELPLADALGKDAAPLIHPFTYMNVTYRDVLVQRWGVLFTSRGCNKTCTFCQTPRFYKKPYSLNIETLEPVIREYRRRKVSQVIILDENFGHFEDYTDEVIGMLSLYGLSWNPMTRVETLYNNYEKWKRHGLRGVSIGLESMNQDSLDGARKGNGLSDRRQLLKWLDRDGILTQTFYIIGFEQDTEASIRENIKDLAQYNVDCPQIQILTPHPETNLFKHISETYGITTYDYSKYDTTHLVWNHPHISASRMRELMFWANDYLFTTRNSLRTARKIVTQACRTVRKHGFYNFGAPLWTGNIDLITQPRPPKRQEVGIEYDRARLTQIQESVKEGL